MLKVTLISWSGGKVKDPRRLVVLAVKTSAGNLRRRDTTYYLSEYSEENVGKWLKEAVKFPSVLEHVTFTFLIRGISRVTSHQLIRHRIASYTQESQRYSVVSKEYVVPESIKLKGYEDRYRALIEDAFKLYEEMVKSGIPPEDARYVLPQAVTTTILMTVNLRELLHIACLRLSSKAQWEIRGLVNAMISEVSKIIPEVKDLINLFCREVS
ncbi:MAG: FAD-dependent thymidylate synthase [Desulfurococcales archaeon]|nr:FAD-dependent thymidylate synthase [Desulfurococcales archaeon]